MKNLINIFVFSLFFFACEKHKDILQFENLIVDPNISKVKDFEIEMPYGNEFYADSISFAKIRIHCFDELGNVVPIDQTILFNYNLYIDDLPYKSPDDKKRIEIKSKIPKSYKLTFEVNGLKKVVMVKAIKKEAGVNKLTEFPILFRVFNENYDQIYFENSIKTINEIYNNQNKVNFLFKLAEYDVDGIKLTRKGVKVITDTKVNANNHTILDSYLIYGGKIDDNIRVYITGDMNQSNSGEYYSNTNSIFLNTLFLNDPNKFQDKNFGRLLSHEIGHYFELKHIYREDNICLVQPGVIDIEAYNRASEYQPENIRNQGKYLSNCGNVKVKANLMDGGVANITSDQKNVIYLSENANH